MEGRKSGRRAIGEGEGKDEGGGQEGVQGRGEKFETAYH